MCPSPLCLQVQYERLGAKMGGDNFVAPVQRVPDFLEGARAWQPVCNMLCLEEDCLWLCLWQRALWFRRTAFRAQGIGIQGNAGNPVSVCLSDPGLSASCYLASQAWPPRASCPPPRIAWGCAPRRCTSCTRPTSPNRCAARSPSSSAACPASRGPRGCCMGWRRAPAHR